MATAYPAALDTYSTKVDGVSDVLAADINNLQDAMVAVQTRLGTLAGPTFVTLSTSQTISGAKTFSSVVGNSNGRYTTSAAGSGMYEMHIPTVAARAWYLSTDGVTRLGITNGGGVTSTVLLAVDGSGNLTATGNVVANSDERLKENWRSVRPDFITALSKVRSGVYDRTDIKATQAGVSAQSLWSVLPEAVSTDSNGTLSVAYGNAALVACVELAKEIVALREQVAQLKGV